MTNEQVTLGQRVQTGRKAAGLSQEQLGEQLEVSRQAVSKWESDGAIPELEKLVAMSRLFGVSLGTLLGIEEAKLPEGELCGEQPEGLTPRELEAVEAIAARYGANPSPKWSKKRKLWTVLASMLACGLVLALCGQFWRMERQFNTLQGQVNGIQSSVSSQIGGITGQVSGLLGQQESLLAAYEIESTDLDVTAGRVAFRVSATPKEQKTGAAAAFIAQLSDGRRLRCDAVADQGAFVARDWKIPLDQEIQISITLTEGETSRTGILETLHNYPPDSVRLQVDGSWNASWASNGSSVRLGELMLNISADLPFHLSPTMVELCIYRNGQTTPEQLFSMEDLPEMFASAGTVEIANWTGYETTVELKAGDTVAAAARITDNYGQVTYVLLGAWAKGAQTLAGRFLPPDWTPGTPIEAIE